MIAIFDYGAGNLRSVANALDAIGADYMLVRSADGLMKASKIVLPGVGHFGQLTRALDAMDARAALTDRIRSGVPFLGICLGMQALFEGSAEAPEERGLGIFPGRVRQFDVPGLRIPHMGWNQVIPRLGARLFEGFPGEPWFYFAHSYYLPECDVTAASCTYSVPYSAAIEKDNVFGVQFHPEKSAAAGQQIVRRFLSV